MQNAKFFEKLQLFLSAMPDVFSYQDAKDYSHKNRIPKRTIGYWLEYLVKQKQIVREKHGLYHKGKSFLAKIDSKVTTANYITDLENIVAESIEQDINLKDGTGKVTGTVSYEPRTPDEIVRVLKIDTKIWELERYWNKEKYDGRWLVSALIARKKKTVVDNLAETLANWTPKMLPVTNPVFLNNLYAEPCVGVLSLQDLHFGKKGNEDIKQLFINAVTYLVLKGYKSCYLKKIILVLGGDLLNMDTFAGTTTSGTLVENGMDATDTFTLTLDKYTEAIQFCSQFCKELEVVYIPGNHDRLSSHHLAVAISRIFQHEPRIKFDIQYAERKVKLEGVNFLGFEHGDVNTKASPLTFATEFASLWGQAEFRTVYTGHLHKKKTTEYITSDETNGIDIKILPSLCSADYYHYHNKWTGNKRRAVFEIHGYESGLLDQFNYVPPKRSLS